MATNGGTDSPSAILSTNKARSLPSSLQPPLPILIHILSFTKLTINDYKYGICGVNRQWCAAATNVPAATVQFIHHQQYQTRELFGACQWRAHLKRSTPSIVTNSRQLAAIKKWNEANPLLLSIPVKMSPYLLAIRKYGHVASFHDFPFTKHLIDLLPADVKNIVLVNGECGLPIYTGPLLLSHSWKPSMLRSFVNLRSNDRSCSSVNVPSDDEQSGPYLALSALIRHLGKSVDQLTEISIIVEPPTDEQQFYMEWDRRQLMTSMSQFQRQLSSSSSSSSSGRIRAQSVFRYNNELPIICDAHPSIPVFEITCVICHLSTRPCCSPFNEKYYKSARVREQAPV